MNRHRQRGVAAARGHQDVEVIVLLGVEVQEQHGNRIGRRVPLAFDQVPTNLQAATCNRGAIEHTNVLGERGDDQLNVGAHEFCGSGGSARFHQYFQPYAEAIGIERFVASWPCASPQIEIEHGCQLLGRRKLDDVGAVFKPAALNDLEENLGLKPGDESIEP